MNLKLLISNKIQAAVKELADCIAGESWGKRPYGLSPFAISRLIHPKSERIMLFLFNSHKIMIYSFVCLLFSQAINFSPLIPFQSEANAQEVKAGFIYLSSANDAGWSHSHDLGRQLIEKMPNVSTNYVESVREGNDAYIDATLFHMANNDYNVIFATSYGYLNSVHKIARQFPKTLFMHCSGDRIRSNVGTYFGRIYQARYLTGLIAGAMTKTNLIGYVAAFPLPEVIRGINAFSLGVREVNPDAKVHVRWTLDWHNPTKEKELALNLIKTKVDVLAQHQDSPATQIVANNHGIYSIGYNQDMSSYAPKAHLTAPIWRWGAIYKHIINRVSAGNNKPENIWWGFERQAVDLAPFGTMVPEAVSQKVLLKKEQITSGQFKVFSGVIRDQNGSIKIPEDARATDEELLKMNWFVEGVVGASSPK